MFRPLPSTPPLSPHTPSLSFPSAGPSHGPAGPFPRDFLGCSHRCRLPSQRRALGSACESGDSHEPGGDGQAETGMWRHGPRESLGQGNQGAKSMCRELMCGLSISDNLPWVEPPLRVCRPPSCRVFDQLDKRLHLMGTAGPLRLLGWWCCQTRCWLHERSSLSEAALVRNKCVARPARCGTAKVATTTFASPPLAWISMP